MRISNGLVAATLVGLVIGLVPSLPFDGTGSNEAPPRMSAADALRSGIESLKGGDKNKAMQSLQYAAEHGNDLAVWQLGQMYANGDGVERDDYKAYEYFQKLANRNSNIVPASPIAPYVANACVILGKYYLTGIPGSPLQANPYMAHRMFNFAALFGHPEAQYQLALLLLEGNGVARDPRRAVQWLDHAANKRHYEAQALLGRILFQGEVGRQQRAPGLMWLIIANDGPGASVPWIAELRDKALQQASEKERNEALALLERWMGRP